MSNKLQLINKGDAVDFKINQQYQDVLIQSIEDWRMENGYYPTEIILNEVMAKRYLNHFKQGVPFRVLYKNKAIYFTVNIRMRSASIFMR